jgi:hypothetical protein
MRIEAKAGEEPTLPNAAPRTNVSEAQEADAAKLQTVVALQETPGPLLPFTRLANAALQRP